MKINNVPAASKAHHHNLTDVQLISLCKQYGSNAILWRRKFLGLLPEVSRRRLYEKKGCSSIFEFAAKYGGVNKEYVQRILCINETFEERGVAALTSILQRGEVSISKLAKVASIATQENENHIIHLVKSLPRTSLETYVRDIKIEMKLPENSDNFESDLLSKNVPGNGITPITSQEQANLTFGDVVAGSEVLKLELAPDIVKQLKYLKSCGIDINQLIREALDQRKKEIQETKQATAEKVNEKEAVRRKSGRAVTRYIPIQVRKTLEREFGTKCAVPQCARDSDHLHHTARFSQSRSHNPYYIAPLCKEHHDIAHLADTKFIRMKTMWE